MALFLFSINHCALCSIVENISKMIFVLHFVPHDQSGSKNHLSEFDLHRGYHSSILLLRKLCSQVSDLGMRCVRVAPVQYYPWQLWQFKSSKLVFNRMWCLLFTFLEGLWGHLYSE